MDWNWWFSHLLWALLGGALGFEAAIFLVLCDFQGREEGRNKT